ncbi:MAG TPA: class IV adenylate cyclase [Candidatus Pacearchaeota archaeon]|nr:hypothetical protein BMS3Abin17_00184 [archaeon BMS3Abin17]HDK42700.1 class IV adenylate cyclase [Candidatus Pacearchaeota archaeon]HDZ61302.1 class IV adenylate cyclase [Candidatus Pacearchaeota archaeon]
MVIFEVETKARVEDVNKLKDRVRKIANFSKKEIKKDSYFGLMEGNYPKKKFRIRHDGEKKIINFKKSMREYGDKFIVVKEEFEFRIKNPKPFLTFMMELGFKQWIKKTKESETYLYKKDKRLAIEINKIKHLGAFIEIEYLAKKNEIKKAIKEIKGVLKELKIKPNHIDNTGYTKMLWKKGIKN